MRQFLAILKDSFREAVDGFVIYVMLGMTGLLLLLLLSLSFTPAPAEEVVPDLVQRFGVYIPDRGRATPVVPALGVAFSATDIRTQGRDVIFQLTAQNRPEAGHADEFRRAVAGWLKPPAGPPQKLQMPVGQKGPRKADAAGMEIGMEFVPDQKVTDEEAAAVSGDQMVAFVVNQVETHLGVRGVTAKIMAVVTPTPRYDFEVTVPGATAGRAWPQDTALFFGGWNFGRFPLAASLHVVEDNVLNGLGAGIALIIGIVITAFFIPNMLRKGALDLIIAKPIGRTPLLVYKYVGGLTFVFLLSVAAIGGAWVVIGAKSGHWDPHFLAVIPLLTFTFAVLYAISTLTAVLTRSAIAAILITLSFAFLLYLVGQFKTIADLKRNTGAPIMGDWPAWMYTAADTLNAVLPRYKDLDKLTGKMIDEGTLPPLAQRAKAGIIEYPSWSGAVGLSLAYIVAFLALACWRFNKRDA